MNIGAMIFDKDGTLLDFDAFWVSVTYKALSEILKKLGREDIPVDEIAQAYGIHDGVTDIDAVLCKGTYAEMGEILCGILNKHGCGVSEAEAIALVNEAYKNSSGEGTVKPTCPELACVLENFRKDGVKLAVVTTDNTEITLECLEKLGIKELFDKIYTDDGKTPTKPDPYSADDFSAFTGIPKANMLMVGDTMTDVRFAKNAGITAVGVAKTEKARAALSGKADIVINSVADLPLHI